MNRTPKGILTGIFIITIVQVCCQSIYRQTIDNYPSIKIDSSLLGIWRVAEDTDNLNFLLVQEPEDGFIEFQTAYRNSSPELQNQKIYDETRIQYEKEKSFIYYITYTSGKGINPMYYQIRSFFSTINNTLFLNIGDINGFMNGYAILRLISINNNKDSLIASVVSDSTLKECRTSMEVRSRIGQNINNPSLYKDTLHLFKIDRFHFNFKGALLISNRQK